LGGLQVGVRNGCAALLRALPPFKGKGRIGDILTRRLTDFSKADECVLICPMRDGTKLWIDIRSGTEKWTLWTGVYSEWEELECFLALVEPGASVLDVGANMGFFTVAVGHRLNGTGKVLAIEPMPQNLTALRKNVAVNHLKNVEIVACGVNKEPGELQMDISPTATTGNAAVKWTDDMPFQVVTETVPVHRLDDLMAQHGLDKVDLLKIDIEGFEWFAFQGAPTLLAERRPVILMELNRPAIRTFGYRVSDIVGLLESHGYVLASMEGRRLVTFSDEGVSPEANTSLLVAPAERLGWVQERLRGQGWDVAVQLAKKEALA
jgi:FkbM family methyltransferase